MWKELLSFEIQCKLIAYPLEDMGYIVIYGIYEAVDRGVVVPRDVLWRPHVEGVYKVNSDAALDSANLMVGFGLVIRDFKGSVMA
ncbi:hypothetical protein QYF36_006927 [Acer negundo]|nr:hypothetical protein QYF36_006927 [Acer negundo]